MAKSLTARQTELIAGGGRAPIVLVQVQTYTDKGAGTAGAAYYFADRSLIYDYGNAGTNRYYLDALLRIDGEIRSEMNHFPDSEGGADPGYSSIRVILANTVSDGAYLADTLRGSNLMLADVEVALLDRNVWVGAGLREDALDLRSLTGDEHVVWFRGEVVAIPSIDEEIAIELRISEPEIPWSLLTDESTNDPIDLGKRKNILYGACKRVPLLNEVVGWYTTLAQEVTASTTGNVNVTDTAGLPASPTTFTIRVAGEEISGCTVSSAGVVSFGTRAANSTTAAAHLAGTMVLEMISADVTLSVADHACEAVDALYIESPFSGELVKVDAANYTANLGTTTVTMTTAQVRTLLNSLEQQALVAAQPTVDHPVTSSITQYPTSINPTTTDWFNEGNAIDGNETTAATTAGPTTDKLSLNFPAVSGTITAQYLIISKSGSDIDVFCGGSSVGTGVHSGTGEFRSGTTDTSNTWSIEAGGAVSIFEVHRVVEFLADAPDVTDTAIAAAEFGYGLRFYADVQGYAAPDGTNYSVGNGVLMEHPSDVLRHLIAVVCGKGHGAIDDTTFDAAVTALGSGHAIACNLADLGSYFRDVAGRIAFEAGLNLIAEPTSSALTWRLLAPTYDSANDVYEFSTASAVTLRAGEFRCREIAADADQLFTRFRFLYDRDPFLGDGEEAFRAVYRADLVSNDISAQVATATFTAAEAKIGRRDHQGVRFFTIEDAASALWTSGYFAQEHMRIPRIFELYEMPWWDAYALTRGDLVYFTPPRSSTALYGRVVSHSYAVGSEAMAITVVEVLT